MGMAPFPTLWKCLGCRMYISVDTKNPETGRWPQGFTEIWCPHCKTWGEPIAPNGHR